MKTLLALGLLIQKPSGLGGPSPLTPCSQGLGATCSCLLSSWISYLIVHIMLFECVFLFSSQGMAFTLEERLQLGIHGLLPPCFLNQDVQVLRVMRNFEKKSSDLEKYVKTILFSSPPSLIFSSLKPPGRPADPVSRHTGFIQSLFPTSPYSPPPRVFILLPLNYMTSQSQNNAGTGFFLPPHCWGALVLAWQSTLLWVQVHNEKAIPAQSAGGRVNTSTEYIDISTKILDGETERTSQLVGKN